MKTMKTNAVTAEMAADQNLPTPVEEAGETVLPELFQHMLFLPGIIDASDEALILAAIALDPRLKPIGMALGGGNLLTLTPTLQEGEKLFHLLMTVPIRSVKLASLQIESCSRVKDHAEGIAIRLPADLVRVLCAYHRVLDQAPYDWGYPVGAKTGFIPEYRNDLAEQLGRKMVGLRFTKIHGLQAQVNSDPRIGEDQVGLSVDDEAWFLEQMEGEGHAELSRYSAKHGTLAGARLFLLRYPAVDPNSGRWLTLTILTDRVGKKIYVNAVTWSEMQGGDEDGDLGYLGHGKEKIRFQAIPVVGEFPRLAMGPQPAEILDTMLAAWEQSQTGDPVQKALAKVQNMMVKDLTGLMTYTIHCIARGAGARGACASQDRTQALKSWMVEVYQLGSLLTEGVMDSKKKDALLQGLYDLADGLLGGIQGEELDAAQFGVFFPEETRAQQLAQMERALSVIGYKLDACRETAYGQVVACGKKLTTGGAKIIDRMLHEGHKRADLWRTLEADATGQQYVPLTMGERPEMDGTCVPAHLEDLLEKYDNLSELKGAVAGQKKKKRDIKFVREGKPTNVKEVFSTLRVIVDGVPMGGCFRVVEPSKEELGAATLTVLFTPAWRKANKQPLRLTIELPVPMAIPGGETEHKLLKMNGVSQRLWRPGFVQNFKEGGVLELKIWGWLQKVLIAVLEDLTHRYHLNNAQKISREFQDAILKAVRKLPVDTELERLVVRREWEILARDGKDQVTVWKERLAILETLAGQGYQMLCTSKNSPGTLVTKANRHGVPAYVAGLNPLAKFGQMHRWCELREYRESVALMHPSLPVVNSINAPAWPKWMSERVANLNVVVMDVDEINRFRGTNGEWFGVDSLICCPSIRTKMALKEVKIVCEDEDERDQVAANFEADGYAVVAYPGPPEKIGNELEKAPWIVQVLGPIMDDGKLKSLIGPIKGVMNLIPNQLTTADGTEIDLIIPWTTVNKKEGWDLVLALFLQAAGITMVDPSHTMDELLLAVWQALDGEDGLTEVVSEGVTLGRALVGQVPFYRPNQTAAQYFRFKRGERGIKIQPHVMLMAGGIGWQTPPRVYTEFTDLVNTREQALATFWSVSGTSERPAVLAAATPLEEDMPSFEGMDVVEALGIETEVVETVVEGPVVDELAMAMAAMQAAQAKLALLTVQKG